MFIRAYRRFFREEWVEWNIGIVHEPISAFLEPNAKHDVRWFPSLAGAKYLADPFGVVRGKKVYAFCEEYDRRTQKGRIVCIEGTEEGCVSDPVVVLELPCHTSYPFLFQDSGEIYCIPETAEAKEIGLYKCVDFPRRWGKVATLVADFAGRDGTVFRHDDRWWLTCTGSDEEESSRELFLWHSPSPFGPWTPHVANPVKTDLGSARPAGTPFTYKGHLYRPAQDCSKTYGRRIVLNRVTRLTPTEFAEQKATVIKPFSKGPYPDGVHTISALGKMTLVDGKRHIFRKSALQNAVVKTMSSMIP